VKRFTGQDAETSLRCLENGLRSFGGAPLLLNLDNFKAAVRNADWFDPDISPKDQPCRGSRRAMWSVGSRSF
jgi:hypothetical protein